MNILANNEAGFDVSVGLGITLQEVNYSLG